MDEVLALPSPVVVVLVGPGASGKSTWASAHFPADAIVSSDRLRALVGAGEDDIAASADALALLDDVVRLRLGRGLTTVIDTLGLDDERRQRWRDLARASRMSVVAIAFDTPAAQCREWNRGRPKQIPTTVLDSQLRSYKHVRDRLEEEGYNAVLRPTAVRVVSPSFATAAQARQRQADRPTGLRFGLHLGRFSWPGGAAKSRARLYEIAAVAEQVGVDAIYVMDHFRQIPQVGRAWDDMLEPFAALGFLAGATERVRLGTLVSAVTYRSVGLLAKSVATLDVVSGGRAVCGIGLGWFREENEALGLTMPPAAHRYAVLEDALRALPMLWGPGSPPFEGETLSMPETLCYPRPLQEHVPVIVGGSGERRTMRLAAQYADASNVFGNPDVVRHKATVLRQHCLDVGRDPAEVELTVLSTALIGRDDAEVSALVERLRPRGRSAAMYAAQVHAGTVGDQVGRLRELAEAGAAEVMLRLPDLTDAEPLDRLGQVIAAFR